MGELMQRVVLAGVLVTLLIVGSLPRAAQADERYCDDVGWGLAQDVFREHPLRTGLEIVPVMREDQPPIDVSCPRFRHLRKLLGYAIKHPDRRSLMDCYFILTRMAEDLPPGSAIRKTYDVMKAARKRTIQK